MCSHCRPGCLTPFLPHASLPPGTEPAFAFAGDVIVQKTKKPFGIQMKTGGQAEGHGHIGVLSRDMLCYRWEVNSYFLLFACGVLTCRSRQCRLFPAPNTVLVAET